MRHQGTLGRIQVVRPFFLFRDLSFSLKAEGSRSFNGKNDVFPKRNPCFLVRGGEPKPIYWRVGLGCRMAVRLRDQLMALPDDARELLLVLCRDAVEIRRKLIRGIQLADSKNAFGEDQLKIDVLADDLIIHSLAESMLVRQVASEEQDEIIEITKARGSWGVAIDPLDGSSNVKSNLAIGTIAGFWNEGGVLEKGCRMDMAVFFLYGPLLSLVYAYKGLGAHEFVFDETLGDFVLRAESLLLPAGSVFGSGALRSEWGTAHRAFIADLEQKNYKLRYSGSLVADFNQILHYGGVFCYPATSKNPSGKLRLLFEANPLAFICQEAGGASFDGQQSILDVEPIRIDQRTPLFLGDEKSIELAKHHYSSNGSK